MPTENSLFVKRIMQQYNKATRERDEFIKYSISDEEPNVWHILISGFSGNENEFEGGEYLVKMIAPKPGKNRQGFPYEPPEFYFMTKNGVYDINTKVCISIGEFHADQYRATLGMAGFAKELVSGMIGWKELGSGISILKTTAKDKKKLAEASVGMNLENHSDLIKKINDNYEIYSKNWKN